MISSEPSLVSRRHHKRVLRYESRCNGLRLLRAQKSRSNLRSCTVPRHKCHQHVLAQSQFADVSRCAVGNHVTLGQLVAHLTMGAGECWCLVRTLILDQVVDVYTDFTGCASASLTRTTMRVAVDISNHTPRWQSRPCRVDRRYALDAGNDKSFSGRSTGTAWRCMLAPMSARFASSCSKKGTKEAATETICAATHPCIERARHPPIQTRLFRGQIPSHP